MQANENLIKPYGDTLNDGSVQLSFTLPIQAGELACEAARVLAGKMGLAEAHVSCIRDMGQGFSFFVVYGKVTSSIDISKLKVIQAEYRKMKKTEVEQFISQNFGRPLKFIGACIESDAHTVGIDAIMNMKGFNGHKGLESFQGIKAYNFGAQVNSEDFVARALELKADALLVSQVVTQKNIHLANLTKLVDVLEAEGIRDKITVVVGGPRITHELAKELGYDAGFGPNTYAEDVASFVVQKMAREERRNDGKN